MRPWLIVSQFMCIKVQLKCILLILDTLAFLCGDFLHCGSTELLYSDDKAHTSICYFF